MPVIAGTFQTKVGIGIETTAGTPPSTPGGWLPVATPKGTDAIKYYADAALRGLPDATFGHYALGGVGEWDADGPFFPDSGGYFPLLLLGGDTVTTAPTATTTSASAAAGTSTLSLTSATGFVAGMAVLIDASPNSEGNIIASITGSTATLLSPLRVAHDSGVAVGGNTLHTLQVAATPKTATIWDYTAVSGTDWRQYSYGTASEFDLKWTAEAECTHSSKLTTLLSALLTSGPSSSFTQVPPFVGWQSGITVAGTQKVNMESFELDLKRKVDPIFAANNTQSPTAIFAGVVSATAKATFIMESEAEYNLFRQGLVEKTQIGLYGPALGDQRTSPSATGLLYTMTNPTATSALIDRSKDYVECQVGWDIDYSASDGGPGQVQITNAITAYA